MTALLAGTPILVILALMLGWRWSAARAGSVGVVVTLGVAFLAFPFPERIDPGLAIASALGGAAAEAGFVALTILWIIGPALGIHQLQLRTGAADVLRTALAAFAPDPRLLALLIAWFFVLFMEGAAGFGSSVALAAPFLVAAGFHPVQAVTVTLVGHVVGVSFGAIGTPIVPQVAATGIPGTEIARATGIYHSLLGWIPLFVMVGMVNRAMPGRGGSRAVWGWTALAFVCFLLPYTLLWQFVGPELPTVGGALVGGILFVLLMARFGPGRQRAIVRKGSVVKRREPEAGENADTREQSPHRPRKILEAAAPYLAVVALVLLTRLAPGLRETLQSIEFRWELTGGFTGSVQPLYHPGSMLLAGFILGAFLQRAARTIVLEAVIDATRKLGPVTAALVAMLLISRIMVHAGMTEALALAAAASTGGAWPLFAPLVGTLGTFVTGSATASNILFTDFQAETASATSLPVVGVIGAQGFGAAVGNMICPHNVVAAGATVGLEGREGEILRRTLWVTLFYAGVGGGLALVLVG